MLADEWVLWQHQIKMGHTRVELHFRKRYVPAHPFLVGVDMARVEVKGEAVVADELEEEAPLLRILRLVPARRAARSRSCANQSYIKRGFYFYYSWTRDVFRTQHVNNPPSFILDSRRVLHPAPVGAWAQIYL